MSRVDVRAIRRKQILEAAEHLAAEQGWTETTILDICQRAGISSGVLTYHFRDKDELLFALLEEIIARLSVRLRTEASSAQTPQQVIHGFLAQLTALMESEPHLPLLLIHFVASSVHRPDIAQRLHALFADLRQRQIRQVRAASERSQRELDDVAVLVSMLHLVALGVVLGRPFLGIDLPYEHLAQEVEHLLLAFLPAPETTSQATQN